MSKRRSNIEKFLALSDEGKAAAVRRAETAPGRPLTPRQRDAWETIQATLRAGHRKRGRPAKGEGVKIISLSMEKGLLARVDALAKREGTSRAQIVARGLETVLRPQA